jgi:hypothetical protein
MTREKEVVVVDVKVVEETRFMMRAGNDHRPARKTVQVSYVE